MTHCFDSNPFFQDLADTAHLDPGLPQVPDQLLTHLGFTGNQQTARTDQSQRGKVQQPAQLARFWENRNLVYVHPKPMPARRTQLLQGSRHTPLGYIVHGRDATGAGSDLGLF